jgi:PmbA protein
VHLAATNGFSGGYARTDALGLLRRDHRRRHGMERDWYAESASIGRPTCPPPRSAAWPANAPPPAPARASRPRAPFRCSTTNASPGADRPSAGAAINGTAIARGASWLRDALGQPVLPAGLDDLTEDPLRPRVAGSRPFDAEGLADRRRDIVADGVLTGWVLDLATARKLGWTSTGNAARGTSRAALARHGRTSR